MRVLTDIAYCGQYITERKMDLFLPEKNETGGCILFIHGGGWVGGRKESWHAVAQHYAEQGYTCAAVSYRLAPRHRFPAQIEDVRRAMSYLKENAAKYSFSADSIVTFGSSAGGYLAIMLAIMLPEDELGDTEGLTIRDTRPSAVVAYCPVTDLRMERQFILDFMGGPRKEMPERYRMADPFERVCEVKTPFLIVQGDADETTTLAQSQAFCDEVLRHGGLAELVVLPKVKHGFGYGTQTEAQQVAIRHVTAFLQNRVTSHA